MMKEIYTIGHSTRGYEEFFELLKENKIDCLIDVRSYPGSRKYPHFNKEVLQDNKYMKYIHLSGLGGRRRVQNVDSRMNDGWKHPSFHNYADHLQSQEFKNEFRVLMNIMKTYKRCVVMCAESVWWRCHRRILTDYLLSQRINVKHIMSTQKVDQATMSEFALHKDGDLIYPKNGFFHFAGLGI